MDHFGFSDSAPQQSAWAASASRWRADPRRPRISRLHDLREESHIGCVPRGSRTIGHRTEPLHGRRKAQYRAIPLAEWALSSLGFTDPSSEARSGLMSQVLCRHPIGHGKGDRRAIPKTDRTRRVPMTHTRRSGIPRAGPRRPKRLPKCACQLSVNERRTHTGRRRFRVPATKVPMSAPKAPQRSPIAMLRRGWKKSDPWTSRIRNTPRLPPPAWW